MCKAVYIRHSKGQALHNMELRLPFLVLAMDRLSRSPDVLCSSRSRGGLRASVLAPFTAPLPSLAGVLMAYIVRIYTRPWHPVRDGKLTRW